MNIFLRCAAAAAALTLLALAPGCEPKTKLGAVTLVKGSEKGEPISEESILTDGRLPDYLLKAYKPAAAYTYQHTYYVSSSEGDDANDGKSEASPFKTLKKLTETVFTPGTGIFLKAGDVFEESAEFQGDGTADQPIVITAYGTGAKPLVKSPKNVLTFNNRSGYVIDSLAVQITIGDELRSNEAGVETQRALLFNYAGDPQGKYGDITVTNCDISGVGNDKNAQGIIFMASYTDSAYASISNVTVTNNTIRDIGWLGMATIAWNNAKSGALAYPGVYNNVLIENNTFINIGHCGSYTHGVEKGLFTRNYGRDLGVYSAPEGAGWGVAGFMTIGTQNFDILYNEIHDVSDANVGFDGVALDIDWTSNFVRVKNNYTYNCYGAGISTMASRDCYISNNRVKGNKVRTYSPRGQITLTDFQADKNPEAMTGISGYGVNQNLIYVDVSGTSGFGGFVHTKGKEWILNSFVGNRVVVLNHSDTRMINMVGDAKIDTFEDNLYFTDRNFKGTLEYLKAGYSDFTKWQEAGYDKNGLVMPLDGTPPSDITAGAARVEDGKIVVEWAPAEDAESGIWHYNIHLGDKDHPVPTYHNLMGETSNTSFSFDAPKTAGTYCVLLTAENNMGKISENAALIEVTVA